MRKKELQGIALVEATHVGPRQRPTSIYLRSSFTTASKGAANLIAQAWHNPNNKVDSCHYVVDETQTLRTMSDYRESYPIGKIPYKNVISINVCYNPPDRPSPLVFEHTVKLVARLCKLHNINVAVLNDKQINKWSAHRWRSRGGIIINDCWGVSNEAFLSLVKLEYRSMQ